ncbi:MAG: hypothetical protein JWR26_1118 [Pedosphaera sp.]|nr:hypothetical protein [Pedosphaera sp.]
MIRKDYILRMIEQLGQVLMRIRGEVNARQFGEAGEDLDQAFRDLIGDGADSVSRLTEEELMARLTLDGPTQMLKEKTLILVALLQEAGQLQAARGSDAERQVCLLKALNLLLTLQMQDMDFESPDFVPRIDMLRDQLDDDALPLRTQAALWRYYEHIGAYGRAEDALFAIQEAEPGNDALLTEAKAFYERLLRQSDESLNEGNLPRAEVEEALAGLRA